MRKSTALLAAGSLIAGGALAAATTAGPVSADPDHFRLQILHASDLEGGVDAIGRAPNFAAIADKLEQDAEADSDINGSILVSAGDNVIPGPFYSAAGDRSLRDVINGVFNDFYSLPTPTADAYDSLREGGGRVDYSIMNVLGFDASAIGNHEFDLGSDALESNLEPDQRPAVEDGPPDGNAADRWIGTQFPYLSANLDFSGDSDLSNLFTDQLLASSEYAKAPDLPFEFADPKIAPYTFVEIDGESIGVVGATTQVLESISSPSGTTVIGPTTNDMPTLATILQPAVDRVLRGGDDAAGTSDDIDKVVLVSHLQQFALEEQLAGLLDGVDVIVAGGSDTILANDPSELAFGDEADRNEYPVLVTGDETVALVSTNGEYSYVGQLLVDFDAAGAVVGVSGRPWASTDANVASLWGDPTTPFAVGQKAELVQRLIAAAEDVVIAKDSEVFGETDVFIEGRRSEVRTQETNLGNLTADANLAIAREFYPDVQVSLKNAGGIRAEIGEVDPDTLELLPPQANALSGRGEGEISQLAIENSLRFNNGLTVLTTTAAGLQTLIEHGVSATGPGATPGQFPQVGGIEFSFDPTLPANDRILSMVIVDEDGTVEDVVVAGGELQGDPDREIRIVTLDFLFNFDGDGYPFSTTTVPGSDTNLTTVPADPGGATFAPAGSEQDALAEFLVANFGIGAGTPFGAADTPAAEDERIQIIGERDDGVDDSFVLGDDGSNTLFGGGSDDQILAGGGGDTAFGFGGADFIDLGPGNDVAFGGSGPDTILDGPGNDVVFPGGGSDTIVVGEGSLTVVGFQRSRDVIDFSGAGFEDVAAFNAAAFTFFRTTFVPLPDGGIVVLFGVRESQLVEGENLIV